MRIRADEVTTTRSIPDLLAMVVRMLQKNVEFIYASTANRMPNPDEIEQLLTIGKGLSAMSSKIPVDTATPGALPLSEMSDDDLERLESKKGKR